MQGVIQDFSRVSLSASVQRTMSNKIWKSGCRADKRTIKSAKMTAYTPPAPLGGFLSGGYWIHVENQKDSRGVAHVHAYW